MEEKLENYQWCLDHVKLILEDLIAAGKELGLTEGQIKQDALRIVTGGTK